MKALRAFLLALFLPVAAHATVTVTTATWTGSLVYGSTVTATTTGAGTKPVQAKTYLFANGENPTAGVVPSTWSAATTFSNNSHVSTQTTNCFNGSGCFGNDVNMLGQSNFSASVDIPDVGAGGKIMMSVVWWTDIDMPDVTCINASHNIKSYRMWAAGTKLNDVYSSQQNDPFNPCNGGMVHDNENNNGLAVTGNDRVYTSPDLPVKNQQQQIIWYWQLNSNAATNNTDGQFIFYQNGVRTVNNNTWRTNTSLDAANGRWALAFPMHMIYANATFPSGNLRWDNVTLDTSWCAVWVTTVSTNIDSATRYFLPVISWADTQVQFALAQKLTPNTSYFTYVEDNNRNVNSSGLSILTSASGGGGPTNTAPTVSAGSNQTITLPATASLSGTASDDSLPNPPATLTYAWSKVSGPGTVTFSAGTSLTTTATFSVSGTYVLRLTANDSALQSTSDVVITVNSATAPANPHPTVIGFHK